MPETNSVETSYQSDSEDQFEDEDQIQSELKKKPKLAMLVTITSAILVSVLFLGIFFVNNTTENAVTVGKKLYTRDAYRSSAKYVRKEIRDMSDDELNAYFSAMWTMKETGRQDNRDYLLKYDDFVAHHMIASANSTQDQAHEYASFMIWHSMLVMEMEIALQSIDPTITIPYWNWTIDQQLEDPATSIVFSDKYFGSPNTDNLYIVDNGPLANFPICNTPLDYVSWQSPYGYLRSTDNYNSAGYVTRMMGESGVLASTTDVNLCLVQQNFSAFWICMWGVYGTEVNASTIHAGVHAYLGGMVVNSVGDMWEGDMIDFDASPNDPIWYSHHAMIDKIWYQWRATVGSTLTSDEDECGGFYVGETVDPQPAGHNLYEKFDPPFYAFRTVEEIATEGSLTLNEACYYFGNDIVPYTYDN